MKDLMVIFCSFFITLLLIRLSWTDIKARIISNKIILLLFLLILPFSWLKYNEIFIFSALIALIIGFLLFTLKTVGAGDVKLISVLMLSLPNEQIIPFFFFTTFSGLLLIIFGWLFFRESIKRDGLPYGVAISIGFLTNLVLFNL